MKPERGEALAFVKSGLSRALQGGETFWSGLQGRAPLGRGLQGGERPWSGLQGGGRGAGQNRLGKKGGPGVKMENAPPGQGWAAAVGGGRPLRSLGRGMAEGAGGVGAGRAGARAGTRESACFSSGQPPAPALAS